MAKSRKTETKVKGLKELADSLKGRRNAHAKGYEDGQIKSAYILLRLSLWLAPMDTGRMASTAYVKVIGSGFNTKALVIYPEEYSIWVHERLDLAHGAVYNRKYAEDIAAGRKSLRRPQEQAKFIEQPLREKRKLFLETIKKTMNEYARQEKRHGG